MVGLKTQFKNVTFGGSWPEKTLRVSELEAALKVIANTVGDCTETDVRTDEVKGALSFVASKIEKGPQLPDRRPHSHRQWAQTKVYQSAVAMELRRIGGVKASLSICLSALTLHSMQSHLQEGLRGIGRCL
jgi:hypothetical protein